MTETHNQYKSHADQLLYTTELSLDHSTATLFLSASSSLLPPSTQSHAQPVCASQQETVW